MAALVGGALTIIVVALTSAGPLDPPAGPVASTGVTLGELKGTVDALGATQIGLPPLAATDVFLKLDGVDGESTDANHDKWIDVLAVSWGAIRPVDPVTGAPAASLVIDDFVVHVGQIDSAFAGVAQALINASILLTATIDFVTPGATTPVLRIDVTNAAVTSLTPILSGPQAGYELSFRGAGATFTYTQFDATGAVIGSTSFNY